MAPRLVGRLDEPLADPGYLAMSYAATLAAQHVKVVLSGNGGDELFRGYEPFLRWDLGEGFSRALSPRMHRWLARAVSMMPMDYGYMGLQQKARYFLRGVGAPRTIRNSLWLAAFTPQEAAAVLKDGEEIACLRLATDGWAEVFGRARQIHGLEEARDPLAGLSREYQQMYLTDCICAHTDKASMAVSLEARSPLLDPAVLRYVNGMPRPWLLQRGQGKWLLRRWIARRLGRALSTRKRGFTVPIAIWLRRELRPFAWRHLNPDAVKAAGVFRSCEVERLWREHQAGRANHAKALWTVLVFQAWWALRWAGGSRACPQVCEGSGRGP
jgi:asparagine synthase (glutamine-hydrolysing)